MKLIRKQNLTLLPLQLLVIKHTRKIICLEEIFVPCLQVRKLAISDLRSETKGSQFESGH